MQNFKFSPISLPIKYVKYRRNDEDDALTNKVLADIGKYVSDEPEVENELVLMTTFNVYELVDGFQLRAAIDEEFNMPIPNKSYITCVFGEFEIHLSPEEVITKINNSFFNTI